MGKKVRKKNENKNPKKAPGLNKEAIEALKKITCSERLKILQELGESSGCAFLVDLLQAFQTSLTQDTTAMETAIKEKNFPQLKKIAHRLAGASASMGTEKIHQICLRLEQQAQSETDQCPNTIQRLVKAISEIEKPLASAIAYLE